MMDQHSRAGADFSSQRPQRQVGDAMVEEVNKTVVDQLGRRHVTTVTYGPSAVNGKVNDQPSRSRCRFEAAWLNSAMGRRRVTAEMDVRGRAVVQIDQAPLRRSTAAECTQAMTCLDELRARWHRFDREDRPAFIRWRAREFGALLSEAREVENRIRDARALVHEVEMEMRRFFQDPHSAYMRVMFRRQNPGSVPEEETAAS